MRPVVRHSLWLGHSGDLRDAKLIHATGIRAVVELADHEPFAPLTRDLIRLRFPLADGGDNPAWLLRLAANSVAALIEARIPVLVCCSGGMSRSLCVAAAALAIIEKSPFAETFSEVAATGPADVAPEFASQMQQAVFPIGR